MALPLGLNMIGEGRVDVLVVVAGLPLIVRRSSSCSRPGLSPRPLPEPVSFGRRGWRATEAGQRMVLITLVALVSAMAPATLVLVALIVLGVVVSRFFEGDEGAPSARPWALLATTLLGAAVFLLPMTVDFLLPAPRPGLFGLAVGPWSAPPSRTCCARRR